MSNFNFIGRIDTLKALASIKSEHWHADTYLRDYPQGPFGECDSVILRFPPRTVHETEELLQQHKEKVDIWDCVWYPVSAELPLIKEIVFNLGRSLQATRIGRVIINRLQPGGRIFRHADTAEHATTWCRFHVVLHALPGVKFYCGEAGREELVQMLTDEIWYFRNELPHEVINESTDPRIHLVIDYRCEEIKP